MDFEHLITLQFDSSIFILPIALFMDYYLIIIIMDNLKLKHMSWLNPTNFIIRIAINFEHTIDFVSHYNINLIVNLQQINFNKLAAHYSVYWLDLINLEQCIVNHFRNFDFKYFIQHLFIILLNLIFVIRGFITNNNISWDSTNIMFRFTKSDINFIIDLALHWYSVKQNFNLD